MKNKNERTEHQIENLIADRRSEIAAHIRVAEDALAKAKKQYASVETLRTELNMLHQELLNKRRGKT